MRTRLKAILVSTTSAIAVALLAFSLTLGTAGIARADDPEALAVTQPEMVLVSAKTLDALEERISYLEGTIATLNESAQHVANRLCVADDSGAQTCVTKSELDALLTRAPHAAETAQPATETGAEPTAPAKEAAAIVPPATNPEPPTPIVSNEGATGSISTGAAPVAEPSARPESEEELGDGS